MVNLKVKKLNPEAVIPTYANDGSNGLDLTATGIIFLNNMIEVRTGIAVEIPEGYVGLLFPRSSIAKKNFMLANSVGVIDQNFRNEIIFKFKLIPEDNAASIYKYNNAYQQGERVGQLLIVPCPTLEVIVVDELSETVRTGGFGSTGA